MQSSQFHCRVPEASTTKVFLARHVLQVPVHLPAKIPGHGTGGGGKIIQPEQRRIETQNRGIEGVRILIE